MKPTGKIFIFILVIGLIFSAVTPGVLANETEKEKKKEKDKDKKKHSGESQSGNDLKSKSGHKPKTKPLPKSDAAPPSQYKRTIIAGGPKVYTGEPGTFIFHQADLKNVLLFFSKTYKMNIVIDPAVSGKVTIRLINVPWDQALDLILRRHGLAMIKEGSLITAKKIKK